MQCVAKEIKNISLLYFFLIYFMFVSPFGVPTTVLLLIADEVGVDEVEGWRIDPLLNAKARKQSPSIIRQVSIHLQIFICRRKMRDTTQCAHNFQLLKDL